MFILALVCTSFSQQSPRKPGHQRVRRNSPNRSALQRGRDRAHRSRALSNAQFEIGIVRTTHNCSRRNVNFSFIHWEMEIASLQIRTATNQIHPG
jgi:hypothetical protein